MNINDILSNINRAFLNPPILHYEEIYHFYKLKMPARDHKKSTGYQLFRLSVAKECRRFGEFNEFRISYAANYLWKELTRTEKLDYIRLAQAVKSSL